MLNTDYTINVADPMGSFTQGFKQAQYIKETQRSNDEYDKKIQRDKLIQELLSKPDLSVNDVAPLIAVADPQQSKQLAASFNLLDDKQKENRLKLASQVMAALNAGSPQTAAKLLRDQAEAYKNIGDTKNAEFAETNAQQIEIDPKHSLLTGALFLSSVGKEGTDILNSLSSFQNSQAALENVPLRQRILEAQAKKEEEYNSPEEQNLRQEERTAKIENLKSLAESRKAAKGLENTHPYLSKAISNGEVSPTVFRGNKTYIDILENAAKSKAEKGESVDWNNLIKETRQAQATGAAAGSSKVLGQRENISNAIALLDDMKETNKKLNLSKLKYKGKLENWAKDVTNDPEFVRYRTQRADNLFQLTNALKQNGITDKSIEIEEQAAALTMTPEAFDAWYETQKTALERGKKEKEISYGPRADYSTNKAAVSKLDFLNKYGR